MLAGSRASARQDSLALSQPEDRGEEAFLPETLRHLLGTQKFEMPMTATATKAVMGLGPCDPRRRWGKGNQLLQDTRRPQQCLRSRGLADSPLPGRKPPEGSHACPGERSWGRGSLAERGAGRAPGQEAEGHPGHRPLEPTCLPGTHLGPSVRDRGVLGREVAQWASLDTWCRLWEQPLQSYRRPGGQVRTGT